MNVSDVSRLLAELDEEKLILLVRELLAKDVSPMEILEECRAGLTKVGERFERKEYFLADLIMSAEVFKGVAALVEPMIKGKSVEKHQASIVIGTVQGDVHDIGKNIVSTILSCSGFQVYDLGVNVPPSAFIEKVKTVKPQVVGLSALLTTAFPAMKRTVDELSQSGLRQQVKIMVGGAVVSEQVREMVGADFYGRDAIGAVQYCRGVGNKSWS